jgi:phytoene/squalene synthetase
VRYADEIVDTFFDHPQQQLLDDFKRQTLQAIEHKFSSNPIIHSFQWVVNRYNMDVKLVESFLNSMALDLTKKEYCDHGFNDYVYGSAEVVGLMCLSVFTNGDKSLYDQLVVPARKLGVAFQKVNFLRDLGTDYMEKGRTYFPGINMERFSESEKQSIINSIKDDFGQVRAGIRGLPQKARKGVLLAYIYYLQLLKKIEKTTVDTLLKKRIRISNCKKVRLLLMIPIINKLNWY